MSNNWQDTKPGRIAPQSPRWHRMFEVRDETGYSPWAIYEAARDADKFRTYFDMLPADLTNVDLSALYLLAADHEQTKELQRREGEWEPTPDNLTTEYNGPVGENREPLPRNWEKWQEAIEAKERARLNRFGKDIYRMKMGDVPKSLRSAALKLADLAVQLDGPREDSEFDGCTAPSDMLAFAAAFRLIEQAMAEIKADVTGLAEAVEESVWEDLESATDALKQLRGEA